MASAFRLRLFFFLRRRSRAHLRAFTHRPSPIHVRSPRRLPTLTARVGFLPVCSLRSPQKYLLASAQTKIPKPRRTNWSPDCPSMGLFQKCPRWEILTQPSNNPQLRFRSSRFRTDFTQTQLRPPQPPMTRKKRPARYSARFGYRFRALDMYTFSAFWL